MKKLLVLFLLVFAVSCKTVHIAKQPQKIASSALELATIGKTTPNFQLNNFEVQAIPLLKEKIKVSASLQKFNKATFKAYVKAANLQGKKNSLKYVDSLTHKPRYVIFTIIDKVTLLKELNSSFNTNIVNYLKYNPKAKIVTTVTMVFDEAILNQLNQAEEIYLSNTNYKKYVLELYKNSKLFQTIEFVNGTVFSYKVSSFCWGLDIKNQLELVNIINENSKCMKPSFKDYQKLEKKKHAFKF